MELAATQSASSWSRLLGISLRPWSGHSPVSLIVHGLIQAAVCIFFLVLGIRASRDEAIIAAGTQAELGMLRNWLAMASIALIAITAIGALRLVVGVLDLVPRKTYTGTVVSMRERRFLDFLPHFALELIFNRRGNTMGVEQRKRRTEVVLATPNGDRQWTVRNSRLRRTIRVGETFRLTVTPLAGYVSAAEPVH